MPLWSIFVDIYSLFEMKNVINLNMCDAPGMGVERKFSRGGQ